MRLKSDVTSKLRRYVSLLEDGMIFSTRDVLHLGSRAAVDKSLQRLIAVGWIRRLTRGLFVKEWLLSRKCSLLEIAVAKARAFGRKIFACPKAILDTSRAGHVFIDDVYYTNGHSTRFRVGSRIVILKQTAPRKRHLIKTKSGATARSLWHLGRHSVDAETCKNAERWFHHSGDDKVAFRNSIRWLPAWLSDMMKDRPWERGGLKPEFIQLNG